MPTHSNLKDFVAKNHHAVAYALGLNPFVVTTDDLEVLVPRVSPKASASKASPGLMLELLRSKRPDSTKDALVEAAKIAERGGVFGRRVPNALSKSRSFSPGLERALQPFREAERKKSFSLLAERFNGLAKNMKGLQALIDSGVDLGSSEAKFQLRYFKREIQSDIRRCNHSARAGMTWAVKSGVPVDSAASAINHIYLRHLDAVGKSFKVVDELYQEFGLQCNVSPQVKDLRERWSEDIAAAKQMEAHETHEEQDNQYEP